MSTNVLVVDDLQSELDLICQYLTEEGYSITTASNGVEALEKIASKKPDLIVTDWMMPEMGGLDLARQLKKDPNTENIPVVACTAKDRNVDRMWATKQGVRGYVTKPFEKQDLLNALQTVLN